MPRLHYYFYGFAIAGTIYGVIYKRLYIPYTTHQREMELVLEAEKFVSQQLLQRAERLYRQVGVAAPSQLPALMANTYGLYNEFEASECQSSVLPKSLYVARLKKIRERCGLLPFYGGSSSTASSNNNDDEDGKSSSSLTFLQQVRVTAAYSIYWFLYRFSPIITTFFLTSCPDQVQELALISILKLLNFPHFSQNNKSESNQVISVESLQDDDDKKRKRIMAENAESIRKDTVFEPRGNSNSLEKPKPRDDEITSSSNREIITADGDETENSDLNVINIAHVSHWTEEVLVRYSLISYLHNNNNNNNHHQNEDKKSGKVKKFTLVVRRASDSLANAENNQQQQQLEGIQKRVVPSIDAEGNVVYNNTNSDSSVSSTTFSSPFLCHGYPWFDKDFVDRVVEEREKELLFSSSSIQESPIVLIRPVTVVSGLNKILWFDEENTNNNKKNNTNKNNLKNNKSSTKKKREMSVEEQLALAEKNNSTLLQSVEHETEFENSNDDGNKQQQLNAYDDLIRRRRTLVNPTRVKEEAEASEREKALTELLYNKKDESSTISKQKEEEEKPANKETTNAKTKKAGDALSKPKLASPLHVWNNNTLDFEELDQQEQENRELETAKNAKPASTLINLNDIVNNNDHQKDDNANEEVVVDENESYRQANKKATGNNSKAIIRVNIGKPCVAHEVWPCILRQFSPEMEQ